MYQVNVRGSERSNVRKTEVNIVRSDANILDPFEGYNALDYYKFKLREEITFFPARTTTHEELFRERIFLASRNSRYGSIPLS